MAGAPGVVTGLTFLPHEALAGVRWGRGGMPALAVAACSRIAPDIAFVPSWEPWAAEALDRIVACGTQVVWAVRGPFGEVAGRDGWTPTIKRSLTVPEGLREDLEARLPHALESVRRGASLGALAIVVAEDLAGADGPLLAPDYVFEELVPLLARIADAAAESALPTVLHSDGDTRALLHAVRHAGYAGLHAGGLDEARFERLFDAARAEGLCVLGGIPTSVLGEGPLAAAGAGTRAALLARRGGLLVTDDGGITRPEELAALVSALAAARESA